MHHFTATQIENITIGERFKLERRIGGGGFGQTYLARDLMAEKEDTLCIVKVLRPQVDDPNTLMQAKRLFAQEAVILERLGHHAQIPELLAYFEEEFYLVLEYIPGHDLLSEFCPGMPLDEASVRKLLVEVLAVLQFIHGQKVVHRDIKPHNLRRRADGSIVLIDFGTVKEVGTVVMGAGRANSSNQSVVAGTHGYMPPEQLRGRPRPNSDLYALGLTAIYALTGQAPTEIPEDPETGRVLWHSEIEGRDISPGLVTLLDGAIEPNPDVRYQTATAMLADLELLEKGKAIARQQPKPSQPKSSSSVKPWWQRLLIPGGVVIALLGGAAFWSYPYVAASLLYRDAQLQAEARDFEGAISTYDRVLELLPESAITWQYKGYAASQLRKFELQLEACDRAVELDPTFFEALNCRGLAYKSLGNHAKARQDLERVVEMQPGFSPGWNNLAEVYAVLERPDAALAALDKATSLDPEYVFAWNNRGNVLLRLERYQEAEAAYSEAIRLDPAYPYARNGRGLARRQLGQLNLALEDFETATQLAPEVLSEGWYYQGLVLLELDPPRYVDAVRALEWAITVRPDYPAAISLREFAQKKILEKRTLVD